MPVVLPCFPRLEKLEPIQLRTSSGCSVIGDRISIYWNACRPWVRNSSQTPLEWSKKYIEIPVSQFQIESALNGHLELNASWFCQHHTSQTVSLPLCFLCNNLLWAKSCPGSFRRAKYWNVAVELLNQMSDKLLGRIAATFKIHTYVLIDVLPVYTNSETTGTALRKEWPTHWQAGFCIFLFIFTLWASFSWGLYYPIPFRGQSWGCACVSYYLTTFLDFRSWQPFCSSTHSCELRVKLRSTGLWAVISWQPRWSMELLALHVKVESSGNGRFGCSSTQTKQRLKAVLIEIEGEHLMRKRCISGTQSS